MAVARQGGDEEERVQQVCTVEYSSCLRFFLIWLCGDCVMARYRVEYGGAMANNTASPSAPMNRPDGRKP